MVGTFAGRAIRGQRLFLGLGKGGMSAAAKQHADSLVWRQQPCNTESWEVLLNMSDPMLTFIRGSLDTRTQMSDTWLVTADLVWAGGHAGPPEHTHTHTHTHTQC